MKGLDKGLEASRDLSPGVPCQAETERLARAALAAVLRSRGRRNSLFDINRAADLIDEDAQDAARWRALMRCGRIKMQGSAGVDPHTGERNGNSVHFGAEFWPEPPKPEYAHLDGGPKSTAWGKACLTALADAVLEYEARSSAKPVECESSRDDQKESS